MDDYLLGMMALAWACVALGTSAFYFGMGLAARAKKKGGHHGR